MQFIHDSSHQTSIQYQPHTQASINDQDRTHHAQQQYLNSHNRGVEKCLHNFVLGRKIGAGTFSKVCIAKHKLTNEQVAIKIIEKSKIQNDGDKDRLNREMKIMRKVRHPNIAQLYEIIQTNKHIYLVMEYAAGGELFDYIVSQQKLSEFEASKFLIQLVDAIEYLHQLGIAHRDLKPENLLLDHKYNIKVTDFGLSNIYPVGKLLNTACGSPSYASPEMLSGKPYDGLKADIWSIGIVLYAMCFGYLPFDNPNTNQLYRQIRLGKFEIPEFASKNLVDILQKILEVDPNQRATVEQIRHHPFCKFSIPSNSPYISNSIPGIIVGLSQMPFQPEIQYEMRTQLNINTQNLLQQIKKNKHNENTCTYYLLLQRWLRNKNKSVSNYYASKYNTINRFALIEKVKENYDRRQLNRMEIRKFQAVQEEMKTKNRETGNRKDKSEKKSLSPRTILKQGHKNADKISGNKVAHTFQHKKPRLTQNRERRDTLEEDQRNHMRNFKNTKINKLIMSDTKMNHKLTKKTNKSRHKSKQKDTRSNSRTKQKSNIFVGVTSPSNILEVPEQFINQRTSKKNTPNKNSKPKGRKSSSCKKQLRTSSSKKKKVVQRSNKQEKKNKNRNKSLTQGKKLKF